MGGTPLSLFSLGVRARTHTQTTVAFTIETGSQLLQTDRGNCGGRFPFSCVFTFACESVRQSQKRCTQAPSTSNTISLIRRSRRPLTFRYISRCINLMVKNPLRQLDSDPRPRPEKTLLTAWVLSGGATQSLHISQNNSVVSFKPSGIPLLNAKCIH